MLGGGLLTHLECSRCGVHQPAHEPVGLCSCGGPLLARYDLDRLHAQEWRERLPASEKSLWRYEALLPVARTAAVTLGEGWTPLLEASPGLCSEIGVARLWFKWEGTNPTGSFKDRGMAMAISRATALGIHRFVVPTAGNAGTAAAAYVQAAGGELDVFMPVDTDEAFFAAVEAKGARLHRVRGLISDCGREAAILREQGAFDLSTLKEPYRLEGKKTMGFELWEQLGGELPDAIVYPTGGGTGLIGMWKAFAELAEAGLLTTPRPRMISVQMMGCAPMVRAFGRGAERADLWEGAHTDVLGLRVPGVVGDFLILRALRESEGTAVAVEEDETFEAVKIIQSRLNLDVAPEGGAVYAALDHLRARGDLRDTDRVVVFLTGSADLYRNILSRHGVRVRG